jgi:hypothetical protein
MSYSTLQCFECLQFYNHYPRSSESSSASASSTTASSSTTIPTGTPTDTPHPTSNHHKDLIGAIIGGVVGGIIFTIACLFAILRCRKRKMSSSTDHKKIDPFRDYLDNYVATDSGESRSSFWQLQEEPELLRNKPTGDNLLKKTTNSVITASTTQEKNLDDSISSTGAVVHPSVEFKLKEIKDGYNKEERATQYRLLRELPPAPRPHSDLLTWKVFSLKEPTLVPAQGLPTIQITCAMIGHSLQTWLLE